MNFCLFSHKTTRNSLSYDKNLIFTLDKNSVKYVSISKFYVQTLEYTFYCFLL